VDNSSNAPIPRTIHFIWLGSEPRAALLNTIERARVLNPDWDVRLWRDDDLDWLENRSWFDSSSTYAGRANIARYEIVLRHGGLYVDADFEFLRPMNDLHVAFEGLLLAPQGPGNFNNAFFGAPAGHPLVARLVERVGPSIAKDPTAITQTTSGPEFLAKELTQWAEETGGTWTTIDRDLVYPYSFDKVDEPFHPLSPQVVAVHLWDQATKGRAWVDGVSRPEPHQRSFFGRLADRARPRSRLRTARGKIDRLTWRPNSLYLGDGRALTVSRAGRSVIYDTADINLLGYLVSRGEWEESFHLFLRKTLSGSDVYVDVGANIGQFVVTASRTLNSHGRVFAFEPNPRAADTLALNIAMSSNAGAPGEVIVRQVAVSNTPGSVTLHIPRFHAGRASIVPEALATIDDQEIDRIEVPCVTLDNELERLSRIRLLKIDVEGNEPAVLAGALNLIESGRVDLIDIESVRRHLGGRLSALGDLLDRWQDLGAKFSSINRKGDLVELPGRASSIISTSDRSHLIIDMRPTQKAGRT
jgi:FkbM family methyltransferase